MLDLSKPFGIYKNVIFYGDHEKNNIVYFLPNEVGLTPVEGTDTFDFFLQIFKEGVAVKGGLKALEDSSGAIMSLGVQCIAQEKFLEEARQLLIERHALDEDFFFSPPEWKDGAIDLIVLDATTQNKPDTDSRPLEDSNSFVDSIIGSNKPSLSGGALRAIFNVRLDRKGAALLRATLQGDRSSVAGVLYELEYKAIRPAVAMTISADLDRCHKKVSHAIAVGAAITYGNFTLSVKADFEFMKEKLIEDGDIKVDLLTDVTDEPTKKMIDELVKEFTDNVMRELFSPFVSPGLPNLPDGVPNPTPGQGLLIGAAYRFKKEKSFHNKRMVVDYRQRSATTKIHNPQAHLWLLGNQIKDQLETYTQVVNFSDLWREQALQVKVSYDFEAEQNGLLSAEILVWKKKDGKLPLSKEGGFDIPNGAHPLLNYTVSKEKNEPQQIAWIINPEESGGYYYQVKFTYDTQMEKVSTPLIVYSQVVSGNSNDLIIFPQVLVPSKQYTFSFGNIDTQKVEKVTIYIRVKDKEEQTLHQEILLLTEENPIATWTVSSHPFDQAFIEEERHYHFKDNRPVLETEPVLLTEEEILISDPFAFKNVQIFPTVMVPDFQNYMEILVRLFYQNPETGFEYKPLLRAKAPEFTLEEITIPVLNYEDSVTYKVQAITKEGVLEDIMQGRTTGGALIIKAKGKNKGSLLKIIWEGPSFESENLDYVRVLLKEELPDGSEQDLESVQLDQATGATPIQHIPIANRNILYRVVKRYKNGQKDKSKFKQLSVDELILSK